MVGIPWRGGDAARERNCDYVTTYVENNVTSNWSVAGSDPAFPFSRAAARNDLAKMANADRFDVVVLHDADMIAPAGAYLEMAERAYDTGTLVIGFTEYRALGQPTSRKVINGRLDPWEAPAVGTLTAWSLGGIVAIRTDVFARVGGYDERFVGWGCEDTAFAVSCAIVTGQACQRTANPAVHLWHPHGQYTARQRELEANAELLKRYNSARSIEDLRAVQAFDDG
jgi:N-terminal domain of galactosyltransferase